MQRLAAIISALWLSCTVPACEPSSAAAATHVGGMPFAIAPSGARFRGRVVEVIHVDGYSYVAVDVDGVRRQLVSLQKKDIVVDAVVDVRAFGTAEGFVSRKLGRTFDTLWFVVLTPSSERAS